MQRNIEVLATIFSLAHLTGEQLQVCKGLAVVDVEALVRYAYRECKSSPHGAALLTDLIGRAEQSGVSLAQWVAEILLVYRWLEKNDKQASLSAIIEYVSCAQEGSDLQVGHSVEWYLDNYGFESACTKR
jgi:hypothetical protein